MNLPFEYDRLALGKFGGSPQTSTDFEGARVITGDGSAPIEEAAIDDEASTLTAH